MKVGELVGRGRTSDVYEFGAGAVVKIPRDAVPRDWPLFEARQTESVRAEGAPAPRVIDVIDLNGRSAIVFERIVGPSMWHQMLADPADVSRLVRDFVAIQRELLTLNIPSGVPDFVDRLIRKVCTAPALSEADREEAVSLVQRLPRGAALVHGDLHPGNVLMADTGPVVIDWFDAAIGHPVADISRTSLLMHPERWAELDHLPDATFDLLDEVHTTYLAEFRTELGSLDDDLSMWRAVIAAGRLAERAESDESGLVSLWMRRNERDVAVNTGAAQ